MLLCVSNSTVVCGTIHSKGNVITTSLMLCSSDFITLFSYLCSCWRIKPLTVYILLDIQRQILLNHSDNWAELSYLLWNPLDIKICHLQSVNFGCWLLNWTQRNTYIPLTSLEWFYIFWMQLYLFVSLLQWFNFFNCSKYFSSRLIRYRPINCLINFHTRKDSYQLSTMDL